MNEVELQVKNRRLKFPLQRHLQQPGYCPKQNRKNPNLTHSSANLSAMKRQSKTLSCTY